MLGSTNSYEGLKHDSRVLLGGGHSSSTNSYEGLKRKFGDGSTTLVQCSTNSYEGLKHGKRIGVRLLAHLFNKLL